MTARTLLRALSSVGTVTSVFAFPYVKTFVVSSLFSNLSDLEREVLVAEKLGLQLDDLRRTCSNSLFLLSFIATDEETPPVMARSTHWLAGLSDTEYKPTTPVIKTIHFYGYKGGQARSTLLAEIALSLSSNGWRVLAVDADLEAPSLDTLFGASSGSLSSTLLGVVQGVGSVNPLTVYVSDTDNLGRTDLLNCWPKGESYSIDTAAFALKSALDPGIIEKAMSRVATFATDQQYDVLLIDHRTGISPATLPIMSVLPGACVISVRLDDQWRPARHFLRLVIQRSTVESAIFAIWKPDTEETRSFNQRTYPQRELLLELLANQYGTAGDDEESVVQPDDLSDHLVTWPYDSAFRAERLPSPSNLDVANQNAISEVRSLLRLGEPKRHVVPHQPAFSISGAKDAGDFIVTRALRELLSANNPYSYILGRKGTGKTRLAREISTRGQGESLLVAEDSEDLHGLRAGSAILLDEINRCKDNPEKFWLCLFDSGIKTHSTERTILETSFLDSLAENRSMTEMVRSWPRSSQPRIFLLDSLETTFPSRFMPAFLTALFTVLSLIEGDSTIADHIRFRLFLRKDLAQPAFVQNIEQKLFGKSLELSWDYQSILNFMLSRIGGSPWYAEHFPEVSKEIRDLTTQLREGKVTVLGSENLLARIFPPIVNRNNVSFTTFLRTYFTDSGTEKSPGGSLASDDIRRYYPRVFDNFLSEIPKELKDQAGLLLPILGDRRISQQRIIRAHENAANNYLLGIKQELAYLVNLSANPEDNVIGLDTLINAFDGLKTPFKLDGRVAELNQITGMSTEIIRGALESMKNIGMFEARPDYPGEWRAGRLFKTSLRMKYVRGRASQD